jgi:HTH-type transcriptional regulator/antitoxin HipB
MLYYVYRHKHPVTKAIFYVGKGSGDRAYETCGRTDEWLAARKEIISSCNMDREVEIVHCFDNEEQALELESVEIYRAKLMGFNLVNKQKLKNPTQKKSKELNDPILPIECSPIAQIVKMRRKALGLTQKQLAGYAGTGIRFIIDLEKSKPTLQLGKADQVLRMFGLTISAAEYKGKPIESEPQ